MRELAAADGGRGAPMSVRFDRVSEFGEGVFSWEGLVRSLTAACTTPKDPVHIFTGSAIE